MVSCEAILVGHCTTPRYPSPSIGESGRGETIELRLLIDGEGLRQDQKDQLVGMAGDKLRVILFKTIKKADVKEIRKMAAAEARKITELGVIIDE